MMDNTTDGSASSSSGELFQKKSTAFYVVLIIEISIGLVGNALFLLTLKKARGTSSNTYIAMASLAVADMLACLTLGTYPVQDMLITSSNTQELMCLMQQWIGGACSLCNAVHLFIMATDRFVAICYPHRCVMSYIVIQPSVNL